MNEKELTLFVEIACKYLQQVLPGPTEVLEPTVEFGEPMFSDYSGFIHISGTSEGYAYLTMPAGILRAVLEGMHEPEIHRESLRDIVGEMTSTIISHAREHFGPGFKVSAPHAMEGNQPLPFALPPTHFVLPILWQHQQAQFGLALFS